MASFVFVHADRGSGVPWTFSLRNTSARYALSLEVCIISLLIVYIFGIPLPECAESVDSGTATQSRPYIRKGPHTRTVSVADFRHPFSAKLLILWLYGRSVEENRGPRRGSGAAARG